MSDFDLQADGNSPGPFVDDDDLPNVDELFDFEAASEEIDSHGYRDVSIAVDEELPEDLSDDDDGLYGETISSTEDVDDEELGEEEDGVTGADSVLSWKIEHSTGDHRLKGMQDERAS